MPKLLLTIGISNSGKSSWAKKYVEENPNTVELNRDMYRFGYLTSAENWQEYGQAPCEKRVSEFLLHDFLEAVRFGKDVILSDTNLSYCTRQKWNMNALRNGLDIEYVVMQSAFYDTFNDPDKVRVLPDHVLDKQYHNFTSFLEEGIKDHVTYTFV